VRTGTCDWLASLHRSTPRSTFDSQDYVDRSDRIDWIERVLSGRLAILDCRLATLESACYLYIIDHLDRTGSSPIGHYWQSSKSIKLPIMSENAPTAANGAITAVPPNARSIITADVYVN